MKAILWDSAGKASVRCRVCANGCLIQPGRIGLCGTRANQDGEMTSLVANVVSACNLDPVEKKPLYHFLPGTGTFSIGSAGCNLRCRFCQNHQISQIGKDGIIHGKRSDPKELVLEADRVQAQSMAFTYNEPTVFLEMVYEAANMAHDLGLRNIMVSNGYMSPDCLTILAPLIDAFNIDLKSFSDKFYSAVCGARLQPVLDNLKRIAGLGRWLEVTTLVIPGLNDSDAELAEIAAFVHDELGPDVPWHVSAFHPAYSMQDRPATPAETIRRAWDAGRNAGLNFVYAGNLRLAFGSNTSCPGCGTTAIQRHGFHARVIGTAGVCPSCGKKLPGIWT